MMSVGVPWIFYIPTLLMMAFCVGGMAWVAMQRRGRGRPKRYAAVALSLILLTQLIFPFFTLLIVRFSGAATSAAISGMMSLVSSGCLILALAFLLIAVFIDRPPSDAGTNWDPGGTPLSDQPSDNPYAAPRQ